MEIIDLLLPTTKGNSCLTSKKKLCFPLMCGDQHSLLSLREGGSGDVGGSGGNLNSYLEARVSHESGTLHVYWPLVKGGFRMEFKKPPT